VENIMLLDDKDVRAFVGRYNPEHYLLKRDNPLAVGPYDVCGYYMEHKMQQAEAMQQAKARILEVAGRFERLTGRKYGFFEEYRMEDADTALVLIGSSAGTAKAAVDKLRSAGKKVGLVKVRVFRPFPAEELAAALDHVKAVAVMDKCESFSTCGGPLFVETRSALYDAPRRPVLLSYIYGLGGRDVSVEHFEDVFDRLETVVKTGQTGPVYQHMGQRG
jgi:pyruvate ferredoxin oxidoreductase alpha subunit